jgi:hypothetical protein
MHGVWEAIAEDRSGTLAQLQAARRTLGLEALVPDSALQQSLRHRPYAAAEQTLAGTFRLAGVARGSELEQHLLRTSARDAVDQLTERLATRTGLGTTKAREAIATAFAESMPAAR